MSADAQRLLVVADAVGRHALPVFLVLLFALLCVTAAAAWAVQRTPLRRVPHTRPSVRVLLARLAVGFAVVVVCGWAFAEVAEKLGDGRTLGRADLALADALQASVPALALQFFAALTHLGDPVTLTAVCIVVGIGLVVQQQHALAVGWVVAVAGNGVLNQVLKHVFARARPVHDTALAQAQGFSFPSGHTSGSVVVFGMLAYLAMRLLPERWIVPVGLAAVALAFSVGASRVFLRVHFASDVIAGFASGAAWLAVCVASLELTRWAARAGERV